MAHDLAMSKGSGENSYAKNSKLQEKALLETKLMIEKSIEEVHTTILPKTIVVADLGCSSGPNTLIFISMVIRAINELRVKIAGHPEDLQFFLNDLPGSDFNYLFKSLEQIDKLVAMDHSRQAITQTPYYVVGLPGSYYSRLLPGQSVHLFHSMYSLHWRSQIFESNQTEFLNDGNIYITATTPATTVKLYQELFRKDFSNFLELRSRELVPGGQMLLTFLGRKNEDVHNGELSVLYGLLARAFQSLVGEGLVEKAKLDSFNLPIYGPSVHEVEAVITEKKLFSVNRIQLLESNWDPYDDSEGCTAPNSTVQSGMNIAKCLRAVMEVIFASHFGGDVLDALFARFASIVAEHLLEEGKGKYAVVAVSLTATGWK